ncbi:MAG: lipopolysaccharide biosynthesis protein [Prevotella sp.]|jgi:teichuronic acid exporter
MSSLKEKTASGLLWSALNSGLMQLLNAVIGVFLARLLLTSDYALVGMVTIFSAIATTIQECGFTSALTNLDHPTDRDYNSVFWFTTLMSIFLYTVLFFCAPLIADYYRQPKLVALSRVSFLSILAAGLGTVPHAYLYRNMIIKETTLLRGGALLVSGIVGITMAFMGMAYWSLVVQQLTYITITSVGKFWLVPWRPSLQIDFGPVRKMFGFSSKILVPNLINQVSQNILTVIFGRIFPVGMVGNFTQAWKWNNMASGTVVGMLGQVAQPVFSTLQHAPEERQAAALRKMVRFTSFLTFPLMFGLAFVAYEFIILLISEKWIDSVPILQLLCLGGAFLALYQPLQNFVISHGRSDLFMWTNISQLMVQLAVILMLHRQGILVMVGVYSAITALWTFVWYHWVARIIHYRLLDFLKDTMPFLLATVVGIAIASIPVYFVHGLLLRFIIKVVVVALVYVGIMRLAGAQIMKESINYLLHRKTQG